jgi:hypothetical protein
MEHRPTWIRLKGVDKADMKRLVIRAVIQMCVKSILLTTIIAVVISIIGYINKWDSSLAYSNAFFLAGCLAFVAGGLSRFAAGQEWNNFQLLSAESFREMSSSERANFIIDVSSSLGTVIFGLLTGILLILISAIAVYIL